MSGEFVEGVPNFARRDLSSSQAAGSNKRTGNEEFIRIVGIDFNPMDTFRS